MKMAESFKHEDTEKKALKPGEQAGMTSSAEQLTADLHVKNIRQETSSFAATSSENTRKVANKELTAEESQQQLDAMLAKQLSQYAEIKDRKELDARTDAAKQVIASINKEIANYS